MPGAGPPGSGWTAGTPGGGSAGAALTSPAPLVSVDMPTPAAIAAAAAMRLKFMVRVPPQTVTTLVTSCLAGLRGNTNGDMSPSCLFLSVAKPDSISDKH
jgi:hypothetical protein